MVDAYQASVDSLQALGADPLSEFERAGVDSRAEAFVRAGAPEALAREVAALRPMTAASDIADLAKSARRPVAAAARLYHQTGSHFRFDRLRAAAGAVGKGDHFERLAVRRLIEDMLSEQCALSRAVTASAGPQAGDSSDSARDAVERWIEGRSELVRKTLRAVEEVEQSAGGWSFAKLTIANAALRELVATA
jgi:glutamate dehydrogenase